MLVALANVITAGIGVYLNISKILFTVVYLPLLVFVVGKALSLFLVVVVQ